MTLASSVATPAIGGSSAAPVSVTVPHGPSVASSLVESIVLGGRSCSWSTAAKSGVNNEEYSFVIDSSSATNDRRPSNLLNSELLTSRPWSASALRQSTPFRTVQAKEYVCAYLIDSDLDALELLELLAQGSDTLLGLLEWSENRRLVRTHSLASLLEHLHHQSHQVARVHCRRVLVRRAFERLESRIDIPLELKQQILHRAIKDVELECRSNIAQQRLKARILELGCFVHVGDLR